jgi:hypothetical protein
MICHRYTSEKADLMNFFLIPRFDVPELVLDGYDAYTLRKTWQNVSNVLCCRFIKIFANLIEIIPHFISEN